MSPKRRFSASDWVDLGLDALSRDGADAVKLEAICAAAGLTRGSFYYHFKDHGAFLVALAHGWAARQTENVVAELEGTPDAQADKLTEAVMEIDYRLELGIREVARRVPEVAEVVRQTDAQRLAVLAEIYRARFDLAADAARDSAFLEYAAFCGMILLEPNLPPDQQRGLAARYEAMVQRALGGGT